MGRRKYNREFQQKEKWWQKHKKAIHDAEQYELVDRVVNGQVVKVKVFPQVQLPEESHTTHYHHHQTTSAYAQRSVSDIKEKLEDRKFDMLHKKGVAATREHPGLDYKKPK